MVVSHDVPEVLSIADYAYIIAEQKIIAQGSAKRATGKSRHRQVKTVLDGIADGPVPFPFSLRGTIRMIY